MTSGPRSWILIVVRSDKRSRLGHRMAVQRRALLLTQRDLAERIRERGVPVTQSAIARWETGECVPALRNRAAVADALMLPVHVLFAEDDEPAEDAA